VVLKSDEDDVAGRNLVDQCFNELASALAAVLDCQEGLDPGHEPALVASDNWASSLSAGAGNCKNCNPTWLGHPSPPPFGHAPRAPPASG